MPFFNEEPKYPTESTGVTADTVQVAVIRPVDTLLTQEKKMQAVRPADNIANGIKTLNHLKDQVHKHVYQNMEQNIDVVEEITSTTTPSRF